ncbi:MAG: ParB/RepB/Spo0J family partition protein [Candidatus Marinimicrobia bacterium]|nr:ParB/RepB/Spo0J family partition protein [Candidatus Neomarinimicrobiota bacterium]MCF7827862.1 ParB/RepB/Spo0J family partition protein [Candidatus Neomarinimicrobiota bacterium]MCF7879383.1 ParB/RepB/Spo0J family partition protein [Candidatus Neomarinimicrobiota bacterium]
MKSKHISISEIALSDETYHYHYHEYDKNPFRRSVQAHGILTPCLLEESEDAYRIVHGFRRIELANEQDIGEIPALISEKSPLENLKWSLIENRVQGEFNLYEQSRVIQVAHNLGAGVSEITADILPILGLHAHKNVYDEYRGFIRLPQPLIEFFVSKDTPVSRTQVFQKLSDEGQEIAVELLEQFSPGINVLDELLTNLYEISHRTEKPVAEIYEELDVETILEEAGQPHIALGEIRQRLQEYRYPVLSETNGEIEKLTAQLELGDRVNVNWDKRLENRGINVSFHWEKVKEIERSVARLSDEETLRLFGRVFKKV